VPTQNDQDIVLLGAGNVATQLGQMFQKAGHQVIQVWNRSKPAGKELAESLDTEYEPNLEELTEKGDLYLLCVSDDAIETVVRQLNIKAGIVVHTSGMTPLDALTGAGEKQGVLYPLQTISKERELDPDQLPLFICGSDKESTQQLKELGASLGSATTEVTQDQLQTLHLAAVFVNNFPNHLWHVAQTLLNGQSLDFTHMLPILQETIDKVREIPPQEAQTGPAARGDRSTIEKHLHKLAEHPQYAHLYRVLTQQIQSEHQKQPNDSSEKDHYLKRMKDITTFVLDLDGVLTDGMGIVTRDKEVWRKLNSKDAYALQLAAKQGYRIMILSGAYPVGVEHRLERLGIEYIFTQSANKLEVYTGFCEEHQLKNAEILHMADDIPDLKVFQRAGVATCPKNAAVELRQQADYISPKKGGQGAVRDVVEKVLRVQGQWLNDGAHIW
jgi:YrbI family 3-deoxy-D-manno-octulosonate 8-phosphate phosphatase